MSPRTPKTRTRIVGVDFSGASRAGERAWIAEAKVDNTAEDDGARLVVRECAPLSELPGSGAARDVALEALRVYIAELGNAVVGLDFPVSLPRVAWGPGVERYDDFLESFEAMYPTPEELRQRVFALGDGRELKRACDAEARVPFAPTNLRMVRQTWHGIARVLAPLVANGHATVAPFHGRRAGCPQLAEVCPASRLKVLGEYKPYKGRSSDARRQRKALLRSLFARGVMVAPGLTARAVADSGGDALDAMLACEGVWRSEMRGELRHVSMADEGRIFGLL